MNQVTEEHVFDTFNTQMRASLTTALKWGDGKLYTSDVQDLDQVYLSGFAKAADRQYHNCSACKSFLRHYGGLLVTNGTETRSALWGFHTALDGHFSISRQLMNAELTKARVNGIFASKLAMLGQPETNGWTHFWTHNPNVHTNPVLTAGQQMAQSRQDFLTLRRGMAEFKVETFAGVSTLMESDAAYRSPKFEGLAKKYLLLKLQVDSVNQIRRDIALWHALANGLPPGIKSSALGTLYADLDGGMAAADALRRFKAIVDPRVYQQPTAAPKAGNIKRAEDIFAAMGLERSLERRVAMFSEVVERCAWEATSFSAPLRAVVETSKKAGIFSGLQQPVAGADPIQGVSTKMSLRKFMEQRSQSVEAMKIVGLDRPHPMGTITAAVHNDAPPLFSWGSTYGWYRWFGVTGKDFGLDTEAEVLGILDLPSTWFDAAGPHTGLMFVLSGAIDQGSVGSGIPAEGLRSELHEVKRTIVAHALNGTLQDIATQHAAGLIVRKDDFKPFVIRANGVDHAITSWE